DTSSPARVSASSVLHTCWKRRASANGNRCGTIVSGDNTNFAHGYRRVRGASCVMPTQLIRILMINILIISTRQGAARHFDRKRRRGCEAAFLRPWTSAFAETSAVALRRHTPHNLTNGEDT